MLKGFLKSPQLSQGEMMQKIILIILLSLLFCMLHLNAAVFGVFVGVEKYDGTVSDLTASVDDAERMYRFFLNYADENQLILIKDKEATKQKILYAMEILFKKAKADDLVVFYFSGHGSPGMFCPHNVKGGVMGLWHTEIKALFKRCKANTKLCIADACFAGSIKGRASSSQQTSATSTISSSNVIIFMSSRDNEVSIESPNQYTGIFTKYLLQGLQGDADSNKDAIVNAYELYSYVRSNVRQSTNGKQTPVMFGNYWKYTPIIRCRQYGDYKHIVD